MFADKFCATVLTQVMSSKLFSYQHCNNQTILCINQPDTCTICSATFDQSAVFIEKPQPLETLKHTHNNPYAIAIRPTQGSFPCSSSDDLHIGLVTSRGTVVHFDQGGVHWSVEGWTDCLTVPLNLDLAQQCMWDLKLQEISGQEQWTSERYFKKRNLKTLIPKFETQSV